MFSCCYTIQNCFYMYIILTSAQSPHGKCGHVHCADCAAISVTASDNIITYQFKQITQQAFIDVIQYHKTEMYHILNDRIVKV